MKIVRALWITVVASLIGSGMPARCVFGRGWGEPRLIDEGPLFDISPRYPYEVFQPTVAMDAWGNAMVVFAEPSDWDAAGTYARYFSRCGGWKEPKQIDIDGTHTTGWEPRVVFDRRGNGLAMYTKRDEEGNGGVFARLFEPGRGWLAAEMKLHHGEADGWDDDRYYHDLAVDANGNALAAFSLFMDEPGANPRLYVNYYEADAGWWGEEIIGDECEAPRLAFAPDGSAMLVYRRLVRIAGRNPEGWLFARLFQPDAGWGDEKRVWSCDMAWNPMIAADADGNYFIAAELEDPRFNGSSRLYVKKYFTARDRWTVSRRLASSNMGIYPLALDCSDDGSALLVYARPVRRGERGRNVWGVFVTGYTPGRWRWSDPFRLDNGETPSYGVDADIEYVARGRAIVVYTQPEEEHTRLYARMTIKRWWSPPEAIDDGAGKVMLPDMAVDPHGNAMVVFSKVVRNIVHVYAARYLYEPCPSSIIFPPGNRGLIPPPNPLPYPTVIPIIFP